MEKLLLSGVLVMLVAACSTPASSERSGSLNQAVYKGDVDTDETSFVMVSVKTSKGTGQCSGTVISPHVVLTAAHCVTPAIIGDGATFQIFLGSDAGSGSGKWLNVKETHGHPNYDPTVVSPESDIGIVVTTSAIPATPVPINRTVLGADAVGKSIRLVGFGLGDPADASQGGGVRRTGKSTIDSVEGPYFTFETGAQFACPGDSGGAILLMQGGKEVIIGVDSTENDLATCSGPGHAPSVELFTSFIDPFVAANDPPAQAGDDAGADAGDGVPPVADAPPSSSSSSGGCSMCTSAVGGGARGVGFGVALALAAALLRRLRAPRS